MGVSARVVFVTLVPGGRGRGGEVGRADLEEVGTEGGDVRGL